MDQCCICSGSVAPDREVYYELTKKLFGEQKVSTHSVPEYMEAAEIPRYLYGMILIPLLHTCYYAIFQVINEYMC